MNAPVTLAFDTATLYFRAFYGLPSSMRAPDGSPVNAVRGLLDSMARLIEVYRPDAVVCAWDNDWRPQWRVDLVPSYKTHRVVAAAAPTTSGSTTTSGQAEESPDELNHQVPVIREVLAAYGVPVVGVDHHEADDVLGSLAHQLAGEVLVVTGDRDLFQLATGTTRVIYIGKGVAKHDLVDADWLKAKYGVSPDQYVDFSVLRGDSSDGLPGVAGIGEKSAAQLIANYGRLDDIVAAASDPRSAMSPGLRTKLAGAIDYLGAAREVVSVVADLEVPTLPELVSSRQSRDEARVASLVERYGLGSSAARFASAWPAATSPTVST